MNWVIAATLISLTIPIIIYSFRHTETAIPTQRAARKEVKSLKWRIWVQETGRPMDYYHAPVSAETLARMKRELWWNRLQRLKAELTITPSCTVVILGFIILGIIILPFAMVILPTLKMMELTGLKKPPRELKHDGSIFCC